MKSLATAALTATAIMAASASQAVVVINATEVGSDVVFSFSGTLDITGATVRSASNTSNSVLASSGYLLMGGGGPNMQYVAATGSFGPFGSLNTSGGILAGDQLSTYSNPAIGFTAGYQSGDQLSGSLTIAGSFASLGLFEGSYSTSVLATGDTVTLNIGAPAVPLPASLPALAGALGLFGLARRRKG